MTVIHRPRPRGGGARHSDEALAPNSPPAIASYRSLLGVPISQQRQFNPRLFFLLALVASGHKTSDAIVDIVADQLHRTTVFALLVEGTDAGLLKFKAVVTNAGTKREFALTPRGRAALDAYAHLLDVCNKPARRKSTTV